MNLPRTLLLLLALLIVSGCETTGDPYADTLFFSTKKADQIIRAKADYLADLKAEARDTEGRISALRGALFRARHHATASRSALAQEGQEIDGLHAELRNVEAGIANVNKSNQNEVRNLEIELNTIKERVLVKERDFASYLEE